MCPSADTEDSAGCYSGGLVQRQEHGPSAVLGGCGGSGLPGRLWGEQLGSSSCSLTLPGLAPWGLFVSHSKGQERGGGGSLTRLRGCLWLVVGAGLCRPASCPGLASGTGMWTRPVLRFNGGVMSTRNRLFQLISSISYGTNRSHQQDTRSLDSVVCINAHFAQRSLMPAPPRQQHCLLLLREARRGPHRRPPRRLPPSAQCPRVRLCRCQGQVSFCKANVCHRVPTRLLLLRHAGCSHVVCCE